MINTGQQAYEAYIAAFPGIDDVWSDLSETMRAGWNNVAAVARKPVVDLSGPDGNAHALMGMTLRLSKQLGIDGPEIVDNMIQSTYEELVELFKENFGDYVDIVESKYHENF